MRGLDAEWTRLCSGNPGEVTLCNHCKPYCPQRAHQRKRPLGQERSFRSKILVPGGGVEPPRGCPRRILSPLRLPVPPSRPVAARLVFAPTRRCQKESKSRQHVRPLQVYRSKVIISPYGRGEREAYAKAIKIAPAVIKVPPSTFNIDSCSPKKSHAKTTTRTTLSLSTGATLEAGPI